MPWWAWAIYGGGALVCWRCVTLSLVAEAERMRAPDDYWPLALVFGAIAAVVWPLVLLFYRPRSRDGE